MPSTSICGTTILSRPDAIRDAQRLAALPPLPRDRGEPVFAEPWQAQAFALAVSLSDQGHFTWKEWAGELAHTLKAAADRGEPDDGSRYYDHWLVTLERLVIAKGFTDHGALVARKDAWATAYENTPHGHPVELIESRSQPTRWILPGLVCIAIAYWVVTSLREWTAIPQVGLFASAGFGSLLGVRHALEPDHLAALSTLITGQRSSAKAAWLGACWGFGHTLTLMAAGALLVVFRADMPAAAADVFELGVVLLLVGFGVRAMHQATSGRATRPTHTHSHGGVSPAAAEPRWTIARRPLVVGAVHGLAGSGALTALVVANLPSTSTRLAYLAVFGVGTTLGMAVLSGVLGWPLARVAGHRRAARALSFAVGGVSTGLGLLWGYPLVGRLF
jgi:nitrile hydratase accessory protein